MLDLFFQGHAIWFSVPALLGTLVFTLRLVLMLVGGDHGIGDHAVDAGGVGDVHGDSTHSFEILSVQSIIAFAMGFGWAGLLALRVFDWSIMASAATAVVGGVAVVWLIAMVMRSMLSLQSSGTIHLDSALGAEGDVYVSVPARGQGQGQVRVVVNNRQRILNAVTDTDGIVSQQRVRVVKVNEDNTVTVAAV